MLPILFLQEKRDRVSRFVFPSQILDQNHLYHLILDIGKRHINDLRMNLQATSAYKLNNFSKRKVINEIFGKQQIKPQHHQSTFHSQFVAKICERPQM